MGILTEIWLVSKYTALRSMLRVDVCWDQGCGIVFFGKKKDETSIRERLRLLNDWFGSVSSIKRKVSNPDSGVGC